MSHPPLKGENLIIIILRDYKLYPHTGTVQNTCLKKCSQQHTHANTQTHTHTLIPGAQESKQRDWDVIYSCGPMMAPGLVPFFVAFICKEGESSCVWFSVRAEKWWRSKEAEKSPKFYSSRAAASLSYIRLVRTHAGLHKRSVVFGGCARTLKDISPPVSDAAVRMWPPVVWGGCLLSFPPAGHA